MFGQAVSAGLFDLRDKNYPIGEGELFRTKQVFVCEVCGLRTNRVETGVNGMLRVICPNSVECWHHDIHDRVVLLRSPDVHPTRADELRGEIAAIKSENEQSLHDDLEDGADPGLSHRCQMTSIFGFRFDPKSGSRCRHTFSHST